MAKVVSIFSAKLNRVRTSKDRPDKAVKGRISEENKKLLRRAFNSN